MNILQKNFLVYGTGVSGQSAVSFLLSRGAKNIYVYDDFKSVDIKETKRLYSLDTINSLDLECVILSPGIKIIDNKNIDIFKNNKIPYFSEFDFGFMFLNGKKICITGTNGKTTTVNLIYNMCKTKYRDVFLCGNTKTPITQIVNKTTKDSIVICEVSSFALETAKHIKPNIASILNISADHIIRHKTFDEYEKVKHSITKLQNENDFFVCLDEFDTKTEAKIINYSLNNKCSGAYIKNNCIYYNNKRIINQKKIKLQGDKNIENILCAVTISKLLGIKNYKIKNVLKHFEGLSHRIQKVFSFNNVTYIDDSKATNVESTIFALDSFRNNVILLLGGSDKGYKFDEIFKHCNNVKQIITFGETNKIIKDCALKNNFDAISFCKMEDALKYAFNIARSGDYVLFSPACASFDEFKSYAERGDKFLEIIKNLSYNNIV